MSRTSARFQMLFLFGLLNGTFPAGLDHATAAGQLPQWLGRVFSLFLRRRRLSNRSKIQTSCWWLNLFLMFHRFWNIVSTKGF